MKQCISISLILAGTFLSLAACHQHTDKNRKIINQQENNITTEHSTDIRRLEGLLDFSGYRPKAVQFKSTVINNSGGLVPGPSDACLEAVLYFDSGAMQQIREFEQRADFQLPDTKKEDFRFDWLDPETLRALEHSEQQSSARPDFFFGTANGQCWYLGNTILLVSTTH